MIVSVKCGLTDWNGAINTNRHGQHRSLWIEIYGFRGWVTPKACVHPQHLAYMVASNLRMEPEERQKLLEINTLQDKLTYLNQFITKELDVLELGKRLQSEVQEELGKSQREYYLREQMKAIRRELCEASETEAESTEHGQKG